jgi:hypothetical protein
MDSVVFAVLMVLSFLCFGALVLTARGIAAARANANEMKSRDSRRRAHDHESGLFDPDCARCAEPFLVGEESAQSGVREKGAPEPKRKGQAA